MLIVVWSKVKVVVPSEIKMRLGRGVREVRQTEDSSPSYESGRGCYRCQSRRMLDWIGLEVRWSSQSRAGSRVVNGREELT